MKDPQSMETADSKHPDLRVAHVDAGNNGHVHGRAASEAFRPTAGAADTPPGSRKNRGDVDMGILRKWLFL